MLNVDRYYIIGKKVDRIKYNKIFSSTNILEMGKINSPIEMSFIVFLYKNNPDFK